MQNIKSKSNSQNFLDAASIIEVPKHLKWNQIKWDGICVSYFADRSELTLKLSSDRDRYHIIEILFCSQPGRPQFENSSLKERWSNYNQKAMISIVPAAIAPSIVFQGDFDKNERLLVQLQPEYLDNLAFSLFNCQVRIPSKLNFFDSTFYHLSSLIKLRLQTRCSSIDDNLYLTSIVRAMIIELLKRHCEVSKLANSKLQPRSTLSPEQLEVVFKYIDTNLGKNITLADMSGCLHMSKSHFSDLFKRSINITPHQYVIKSRVQKAKQLLEQTNLSITEIAEKTGFNTNSHFSRSFRQHANIAPKSHRANILGDRA